MGRQEGDAVGMKRQGNAEAAMEKQEGAETAHAPPEAAGGAMERQEGADTAHAPYETAGAAMERQEGVEAVHAPPEAAGAAMDRQEGVEAAHFLSEAAGAVQCGVCLEGVSEIGELSGCSHAFCFPCAVRWSGTENRCPACRERFILISRKRLNPDGGFEPERAVEGEEGQRMPKRHRGEVLETVITEDRVQVGLHGDLPAASACMHAWQLHAGPGGTTHHLPALPFLAPGVAPSRAAGPQP